MLKIILVIIAALYLLAGFLIFYKVVRDLGGAKEAGYSNVFLLIIGCITVMLLWPIFFIAGLSRLNKKKGE